MRRRHAVHDMKKCPVCSQFVRLVAIWLQIVGIISSTDASADASVDADMLMLICWCWYAGADMLMLVLVLTNYHDTWFLHVASTHNIVHSSSDGAAAAAAFFSACASHRSISVTVFLHPVLHTSDVVGFGRSPVLQCALQSMEAPLFTAEEHPERQWSYRVGRGTSFWNCLQRTGQSFSWTGQCFNPCAMDRMDETRRRTRIVFLLDDLIVVGDVLNFSNFDCKNPY